MIEIEYLKDAHRYGPWEFDAWLKTVVQAGLYTPIPGKPGEYNFHPERMTEVKQAIDAASGKWLECMITGHAKGQEREASNVTCIEHRKKIFNGEHVNDGSTRCNHRRYVKKAQAVPPAKPRTARPGGRAS